MSGLRLGDIPLTEVETMSYESFMSFMDSMTYWPSSLVIEPPMRDGGWGLLYFDLGYKRIYPDLSPLLAGPP